jgi:hypothetical protein
MAALGWRQQWPVSASVLAASLFMFGGAASARLQHTGIIVCYGLFPLALLFLQLALDRRSHIMALGFAVTAVSVALGRSQVALLLCLLLLAAAMAEIISSPSPLRYLRERSGVLTTMAVAGGALLAVPLLLTLQFAELSNRPAEQLAEALRGSLYPANLATLAVPNIFGTHGHYWGPGAATLAEVDLTDDSENYLFVGAIPTLLLIWFGVAGGRAWQVGRRLMTSALAIACLFMLGRYTPLYRLAFQFAPGIDLFRRPTDASFVFGIAVSVLAGHWLADYVRDGVPRLRPFGTLVAVMAWLAVVGSAIAFSANTGHALDAACEAAMTIAIMLVAGVLLFSARHHPARGAAIGLVTLAAIAELLWWNTASRLNGEPWELYRVLEAPGGAEAAAINLLEQAIAAVYPRVEVLGLGGPWQNLAMVRGWDATNGYNPLRIGLYDQLVSPGEQNWDVSQRQFPPSFANYDSPRAKALGLTYLVLGQPIERLPDLTTPPASELLLSGPPVWIYRIPGAIPRLKLVEPSAPENSLGTVRIESRAPDRVEVITTSISAARLVLHDVDYPGWIAEIDGNATPIMRAEMLFRAVEVPPGNHRVTFRFTPLSLGNLGAALRAVIKGR